MERYLKVSEAAEMLGVTPTTLRNWDKKNQLTPYRHPINKYRLYLKSDIEKLLNKIRKGKTK